MEASAIPASVGLARTRTAIGAPLFRLRSDDQLVSMFRSGSEEAFRAIHDRYRARLFAYTRQMLAGSAADAEDAVQEIFVRAYAGLRASHRELALRPWLYRIAHNRCIDELRRPQMMPTEQIPAAAAGSGPDPVAQTEQRDALRRLIVDVGRLPEQQRSALLMRELGGMTYADVSGALGVSVPAVKSLLVRARVGLAQASEARDTACSQIREDLIVAHDRGVRASGLARRHMRDCPSCRQFRREVRGVSRRFAALLPALGPVGVIAKLLGLGGAGGGGAAAGTGAVAGGGATASGVAATGAAATGVVSTGVAAGVVSGGATAGSIAGAGHVVTLLAAALVTAGGVIEIQHIAPPVHPRAHHERVIARPASPRPVAAVPVRPAFSGGVAIAGPAQPVEAPATSVPAATATATPDSAPAAAGPGAAGAHRRARHSARRLPLIQRLDPDNLFYVTVGPGSPGSQILPAGGSTGSGTGTTPATPGTATAGAPGTTSPVAPAPAGTTTSTPATTGTGTTTGTGSAAGTGTGQSSGQSAPAGTGTGTGTSTGTSSSSSSGQASGTGTTPATVTPDSSGSFSSGSGSSGGSARGSGTIAVFTMTGN